MKLLPYEHFELSTFLSPENAMKLLSENTDPNWISFNPHKIFHGTVKCDGFKITPIIAYHNSFLPVLKGSITHEGSSSKIKVTLRMLIGVNIFLLIALVFVTLATISTLLSMGFSFLSFSPYGMMLLIYLLSSFGFWHEVKKSKKKFISIFQETLYK